MVIYLRIDPTLLRCREKGHSINNTNFPSHPLPLLSFYSLCLQRPEGSSILGHDYRPLWSLKRKKMGCIVRVKSIPPIFFFHIYPPPLFFIFTLGGEIGMAVPPSFTILLMCFKVMMGDINNRKSPVSVWKRPLENVDLFTVLGSTFRNSRYI